MLLSMGLIIAVNERASSLGWRENIQKPSPKRTPVKKTVDLQIRTGFQLIPQYIDLAVGDTLTATKANGESVDIRVVSIGIDSAALSHPRTRVDLEAGGRTYAVYCGMDKPRRGGLGPTEIEGLKVGVEVTRLLFSRIKGGSSPFNTYEALRLQNDVRLVVWDGTRGTMPGVRGRFVVNQPVWTRGRFGNWLHKTSYGIHSAIDIFATTHNIPEEVRSPVKGTVYRVYNRDSSPDDSSKNKAVNIYGDVAVGPHGEKILYRFFHFSKILVSDGQPVEPGQIIGLTGHTGFHPSIGDHLHLEIRLNPSHFGLPRNEDIFATIPVNPYYYLLEWYEAE
jgi:murein DD-endopeptidase MepM/ murein hydrolase activator NlpD